jgi:hypothetical protein
MNDNEIIPNIWAVITLLRADEHLIHVEVEDGVVYLEGLAPSHPRKQALENALLGLAGVRRVVNCLAIEQEARLPHILPAPHSSPYQTTLEAILTLPRVPS